jgi:hypothetical protein
MASTVRFIGLAGSPAVTATSAGLTAYRLTHSPDTSVKIAVLAGLLTLVSLMALALVQLAECWIDHRAEHHFSYAIKRTVKVATSGVESERRDAALATSERLGITGLAEGALNAMKITREAPQPLGRDASPE